MQMNLKLNVYVSSIDGIYVHAITTNNAFRAEKLKFVLYAAWGVNTVHTQSLNRNSEICFC